MRRLIVCFDGTWNTPTMELDGVAVPTNVYRIYNAIAACARNAQGEPIPDEPQEKYYHTGVGTEGGVLSKALGGAMGKGLDGIIMSGYRWLCDNVKSGDERIFLFGFSRGAFTARSLGGFIRRCGLLDLARCGGRDPWRAVAKAFYYGYRRRLERERWRLGQPAFVIEPMTRGAVYAIGVWDTVGAMGIPDGLPFFHWFDRPSAYRFHDTDLTDSVTHARHALALDESRGSFTATLWTPPKPGEGAPCPDVKQVWFPGEHADVGGGRKERGLADGALLWMIGEMEDLGLSFDANMVSQIAPNSLDVAHNPLKGFYKALAIQPRTVPCLSAENAERIHGSALERQSCPPIAQSPYRPTIVLAPGKSATVPIYAAEPWNSTGVFLEPGATYECSAEGVWLHGSLKCSPRGGLRGIAWAVPLWSNIRVVPRVLWGGVALCFGWLWGRLERPYQWITGNHYIDLVGSKRVEDAPWFSLIGVVANAGNPNRNGTPEPHATFRLGASRIVSVTAGGTPQTAARARFRTKEQVTVARGGYLYAFMNVPWISYGNNKGQVKLTVHRVAPERSREA